MNLLAIILYNHVGGEPRVVDFQPGQLNIVTGWSATGKSALLDIVEFCLGRDTVTMPVGPITDTVAWYAVLLQLPSTQAFLARPAPKPGRASTQQAMLEFGTHLQPPPFEELTVNADSTAVREQVGRLLGIGENQHEPASGGGHPLEANLGHATLLCLQRQSEIGDRTLLFHRQGETRVAEAIRDTVPYFLGAVSSDQAVKRQELQTARRGLRRLEADLANAERLNDDVEVELRALLAEAQARSLVATPNVRGRDEIIAALTHALGVPAAQPSADDGDSTTSRRGLEERRDRLRRDLRALTEQRALFDQQTSGEQKYETVVREGAGRLQSLNLIPIDIDSPAGSCPMCGSELPERDPTIEQLQDSLAGLRRQLRDVETSRPRRAAVMRDLDQRLDALRQDLRATESALAGLRASDAVLDANRRLSESQAFTKGRIDLYLTKLRQVGDENALQRIRGRVQLARRTVERLEAQLDPEQEREQVTSRLLVIGKDMTRWADRLQLEHHGGDVRLDLHRLTVVTDTDNGPAPLFRIGSAANWIGYHLVAHLALHRYFVRQDRPVPHFLMLDQPTQAYYPSEVEQRDGVPAADDDRAAVRRLFELLRDVANELAPNLQIIVCDHANLTESWFQDAVRHNWRGTALIPADWIASRPTK